MEKKLYLEMDWEFLKENREKCHKNTRYTKILDKNIVENFQTIFLGNFLIRKWQLWSKNE